jgi:hypothetical protein
MSAASAKFGGRFFFVPRLGDVAAQSRLPKALPSNIKIIVFLHFHFNREKKFIGTIEIFKVVQHIKIN